MDRDAFGLTEDDYGFDDDDEAFEQYGVFTSPAMFQGAGYRGYSGADVITMPSMAAVANTDFFGEATAVNTNYFGNATAARQVDSASSSYADAASQAGFEPDSYASGFEGGERDSFTAADFAGESMGFLTMSPELAMEMSIVAMDEERYGDSEDEFAGLPAIDGSGVQGSDESRAVGNSNSGEANEAGGSSSGGIYAAGDSSCRGTYAAGGFGSDEWDDWDDDAIPFAFGEF